MAITEPIRNKKQLQKLAGYWLRRGNLRKHTLIVLGVCTALRISDYPKMPCVCHQTSVGRIYRTKRKMRYMEVYR